MFDAAVCAVAAGLPCCAVLCVQVAWLNNPEKDKDHAHLPSDMTAILQMYPGRLSPMAANLFYLAIIGDPLRPESTNMAKIMTTVRARCAAAQPRMWRGSWGRGLLAGAEMSTA